MQLFRTLLRCSAVLGFSMGLAGIVNGAPGGSKNDAINLFPREITPGGTLLIPYFTSKSLVRRDQIPLRTSEDSSTANSDIEAVQLPEAGQAIELFYGEEKPTSTDPFITKITFTPSENRTLLVLENYLDIPGNTKPDVLFTHVSCKILEAGIENNATLVMDKTTTSEQFDRWVESILADQEQELVVITSSIMPGCGKRERLAFLVNSAKISSSKTSLIALPLEWSSVALKLSIQFGKASTMIPSFGSRGSLTKRFDFNDIPAIFTSTIPEFVEDILGGGDDDEDEEEEKEEKKGDDDQDDDENGGNFDEDLRLNKTVNLTNNVSIPSRLQLLPLSSDILPKIDVDLPFDIPFLPQEEGQNDSDSNKTDSTLTVTCVNCNLTGEFNLFGALDVETSLKDLKIMAVESAMIGLSVTQDIVARLELEFATGETPVEIAFQQSIFPLLGSQSGIKIARFGIPELFELAPYFDYAIGVSVAVSAPKTNVTFGGELRIPKGSSLNWNMNNDVSTQNGWDTDVTSFPVKVNSAPTDLEGFTLGVNFTSVPSVTLNLEMGPVDIGARIAMLLPRIYTKSTVVTNVTSSCIPPGTDDFTYFPTAVLFQSGLHTALYGELYADVGIDSIGKGNFSLTKGIAHTHTIWEHTLPFSDSCLLFGDSKTGLGELRNSTTLAAKSEEVWDLKKIEEKYIKDGELPPVIDIETLKNMEGLPETLKTALFKNEATGDVEGDTESPKSDEENAASRVHYGWLNGNDKLVWVVAIVAIGILNGLFD